jgi:hypothetical protein
MVSGQPEERLTRGRLTLMLIVKHSDRGFLYMMVGGALPGIVAWSVFFFPVRAAVWPIVRGN